MFCEKVDLTGAAAEISIARRTILETKHNAVRGVCRRVNYPFAWIFSERTRPACVGSIFFSFLLFLPWKRSRTSFESRAAIALHQLEVVLYQWIKITGTIINTDWKFPKWRSKRKLFPPWSPSSGALLSPRLLLGVRKQELPQPSKELLALFQ